MKTTDIDQLIDEAGQESFPASDAPAWPAGVDRERVAPPLNHYNSPKALGSRPATPDKRNKKPSSS